MDNIIDGCFFIKIDKLHRTALYPIWTLFWDIFSLLEWELDQKNEDSVNNALDHKVFVVFIIFAIKVIKAEKKLELIWVTIVKYVLHSFAITLTEKNEFPDLQEQCSCGD